MSEDNLGVGEKHPYHLVDPSPLPLMGSIAGLAMAAGLVFFMHYETKWLLILGTIGLLTVMFLWWREVIKESTEQQVSSPSNCMGHMWCRLKLGSLCILEIE